MRRLALLAAVLASLAATGCSSGGGGGGGDTTPPAVPVISAPRDGATLDATKLVAGQVVFSGSAEAGATLELQIAGTTTASGTVVATAGEAWTFAATLPSGGYTVCARATDAAGNASPFSAVITFSVDTTRLATPVPAGSPLPVTSWGQTVPVTAADASGLGELFPGQANSWVLNPDFSLGAGYGLQYSNALVLYSGVPTSPTSHASLLTDLPGNRFRAFPGDQASSEATFLSPTLSADGGLRAWAIDDGASMSVPAIAGKSAYLNGTASSVLGGYLLEFAPGETYTFGWTHQAVLDGGRLDGADAAPYAPSYQVVLRTPSLPMQVIGEPLFSSTTNVLRATESVTRSGLPQYAVLQFELRSAAPGYAEFDALTLSDSTGPIALRNPDFEYGADGWATALSGGGSQNVRSGARAVGAAGSALRVTRTFYAPVTATWGRMVDVFENTGATDVTTTVLYATLLGGASPLAAVIPGGGAVVGWDGAAAVRDVGIVFGSGAAYVADGSPFVFVTHDLTVPAGGKAALVHFVVQLGEAAGGATVAGVPAATEAECAAIVAGYLLPNTPMGEDYQTYFEPDVRALVANF